MSAVNPWLSRFQHRLQDFGSPVAYWLSLTALQVGIIGALWSLPVPDAFADLSPYLNWGSAFLLAALSYYFIISVPLGTGMLPVIVGLGALLAWLDAQPLPLDMASAVLVGAGVSGLVFGHFASGGIRAVAGDVQLSMIAPLWLLALVYRRLGIPH